VYGSASGFDSIAEAFGPFARNIYAVETGLSSNPSMNWRIKELDNRSIVSFSDAHSGPKIGREATVFELKDTSYDSIYQAIAQTPNAQTNNQQLTTNNHIFYTLEFYPEEGKYHYTGHRNCGIKYGPKETIQKGIVCPVCHRNLTQGVMQRVEELAGSREESLQLSDLNNGVKMIGSKAFPNRPPFAMLVPLQEIISEAIGSPVQSTKTQSLYLSLVEKLGGEFQVLLRSTESEIAGISNGKTAEGVIKVRKGDIVIDPGFDGVFGVVKIWKEESKNPAVEAPKEQLSLFQ
jgi:PHP family Zn ribbon phosphoesterase